MGKRDQHPLRIRPAEETDAWRANVAAAIVREYGADLSATELRELSELAAVHWCLAWFGHGVGVSFDTIRAVHDRARQVGERKQAEADENRDDQA